MQILPVPGFAQIILQQFAETQDGVHGRADFVAHVGQKSGFFLVAVFGLKFGLHQFVFAFLLSQKNLGQPKSDDARSDSRGASATLVRLARENLPVELSTDL